jgi:hypothetical protein
MSKTPIIIGVAMVMVVILIAIAAYFMMGGEEAAPVVVATSAPEPAAVPVGPPNGRYIKLEQTVAYDADAPGNTDDKNKIINLAELEVFDTDGTNLASGKTVTGSSEYSSTHGYINLTDGNKTNIAHTIGRTEEEFDYLQVDLGSVKEIKKIVITNRTDCCKDRAVGIKAVVLGADGTTVIKETPVIATTADTYTLTFPENVWS